MSVQSLLEAIAQLPDAEREELLARLREIYGSPPPLRQMGLDSFILTRDVGAALVREGVVGKPPSSARDLAATQAAFNEWAAQSGRPFNHISRVLAFSVG